MPGRTPLAVLTLVGAMVIGGCGGDAKGEQATPSSGQSSKADEAEIADLAGRYVRSLTQGDYEGACSTRSAQERAELARLAGTCARALEGAILAKSTPAAVRRLFGEARVGTVRIHGNKAAVAVVQPGQTKPAAVLGAVRSKSGRWGMVDLSEAKLKKLNRP